MTAADIVAELKPLGKESYKKVLLNHGIQEPVFGVSIEQLKKIQKRIKVDYELALALYDTGIYDAMYFAGLIADDAKMTKADLNRWVAGAPSGSLCGYAVFLLPHLFLLKVHENHVEAPGTDRNYGPASARWSIGLLPALVEAWQVEQRIH